MSEQTTDVLARKQSELIGAGFVPVRHGFVVRLVRRILWPFIRPFHFHTVRQMVASAADTSALAQTVSRLQASFDELQVTSARLGHIVQRLEHELSMFKSEDVHRLTLQQTDLRTEFIAIANRCHAAETEIEELSGKLNGRM